MAVRNLDVSTMPLNKVLINSMAVLLMNNSRKIQLVENK